jgi:hypothetical protein
LTVRSLTPNTDSRQAPCFAHNLDVPLINLIEHPWFSPLLPLFVPLSEHLDQPGFLLLRLHLSRCFCGNAQGDEFLDGRSLDQVERTFDQAD